MARLNRRTITSGSRVMLWAYPSLSAWIGLAYILGDPARTQSSSFATASSLMPIPAWGYLFLSLGLFGFVARIVGNRPLLVVKLIIGTGVYAFWGSLFALSVLRYDYPVDGPVPPTLVSPAIWMFVAACHVASAWSLGKDHVIYAHSRHTTPPR